MRTREQELISNMVEYLAELWERDSDEEWSTHWQDIIGMSEDDMEKYDLLRG